MRLFSKLLFMTFAGVLMAIEETQMALCNIYGGETFLPNFNWSLMETRQLLPSSLPTITDCAMLCLTSTLCQTSVFDAQAATCVMFREGLQTNGQLVSASSNSITTISVQKDPCKTLDSFFIVVLLFEQGLYLPTAVKNRNK
jgi:hypothetical protein